MRYALLLVASAVLLAGCLGMSGNAPAPRNDSIGGPGGPGSAVPAAPNPVCAIDATVSGTDTVTVSTGPPEQEDRITVEKINVTIRNVEIADVARNRRNNFTDPDACIVAQGEQRTVILRDPAEATLTAGNRIAAYAHLEGDEWFHGIFVWNVTKR